MKLLIFALLPLTAFAFQPDVIIDNANSSAVEFVGPWAADTTLTNAFRGTAQIITGTTANAGQFARFHTLLPASGPWKVFVWHNGRAGFCDDAQAVVKVADGDLSTVTVAQNGSAGQWMMLGTYWFNNTEEAEVKLLHNDSGMLSADAVRFSFASPDVVLDSTGDSTGIKLYNGSNVISSATWPSIATDLSGNELNLRRSSTVNSRVEFIPVLPAPGDYEVSVWLPRRNGPWVNAGTGATSVEIDIVHRTGTATHTVALPTDNGAHEGAWVQVGTTPYRFDATPVGQTAGGPGKVIVKGPATAGTCVPADAVRWSKVGTIAIYQDDEDPTGVLLGTKLSNQTVNWLEQYFDSRAARTFLYYDYHPFGLRSMRAMDNNQRATYTPPLPEQGLYDVYLWYPYYSHNAATGQLIINGAYNAGGNPGDVTRILDQRYNGGKWAHVGRYILDANAVNQPAKSWLTLEPNNNVTAKYTKADSVLFLRDGEETDADNDGLPDWKEIVLHTNSSGLDLNNDGIADGWDTDGDGMSDGYEYSLGLNPLSQLQATDDPTLVGFTVITPLTQPAQ